MGRVARLPPASPRALPGTLARPGGITWSSVPPPLSLCRPTAIEEAPTQLVLSGLGRAPQEIDRPLLLHRAETKQVSTVGPETPFPTAEGGGA